MVSMATTATMARTRHYGHGRGGKVVVVTRKLGGVGAEPTIVSPFHNSTSQSRSRAQQQAYNQEPRRAPVFSVQCPGSSVLGAVSHRVGENKDHASCRAREGGRRCPV